MLETVESGMEQPIYVVSSESREGRKYHTLRTKILFKFNPPPSGVEEVEWIKRGFEYLVDQMKRETTSDDDERLGFTFTSLNFKTKEPGYVAFRKASDISSDLLWTIFGGLIQSNSSGAAAAAALTSSDNFEITCTRVSPGNK